MQNITDQPELFVGIINPMPEVGRTRVGVYPEGVQGRV